MKNTKLSLFKLLSNIFVWGCIIFITFALPATAKESVAILELQPKAEALSEESHLLTDRIRLILVNSGQYIVLERHIINRILKEQGFQSTQLCRGNECNVEIGRLLSVRQMLTGSVTRLGNLYSLNLRLVDVESGQILKEAMQDCRCSFEKVLSESIPELVMGIFGSQLSEAALKASSDANSKTVRMMRPVMTFIEGGIPLAHPRGVAYGGFVSTRYASVGGFYNFNPYLALGGQIGIEGMIATVSPFISGNVRLYTNPDNLAGFLDLGLGAYSFLPAVSARAGLEYRDSSGFTIGGSGGYSQSLWNGSSRIDFVYSGFSLEFYTGYSF